MSLRAEYKVTAELDLESLWTLFVHYQGNEVRRLTKVYTSGLIQESARLINEHMEKVTQEILSGPPVVAQRSQFDPREDPTDHE